VSCHVVSAVSRVTYLDWMRNEARYDVVLGVRIALLEPNPLEEADHVRVAVVVERVVRHAALACAGALVLVVRRERLVPLGVAQARVLDRRRDREGPHARECRVDRRRALIKVVDAAAVAVRHAAVQQTAWVVVAKVAGCRVHDDRARTRRRDRRRVAGRVLEAERRAALGTPRGRCTREMHRAAVEGLVEVAQTRHGEGERQLIAIGEWRLVRHGERLVWEWESGHSLARWRRTNETYRDSRSSINKSITIRADIIIVLY